MVEINGGGGQNKKKGQMPNRVQAGIARCQLEGVFCLPDPGSEFHQMGLGCLGDDSGDLREVCPLLHPPTPFNF